MSDFWIVAIGTLAAAVLLIAILRLPGPDPRLAAESLPKIARDVALSFGGYWALSLLIGALPGELRLPVVVAVAAATILVSVWWYRRHPPSAPPVAPIELSAASEAADEPVITGGEWLRALVPVTFLVAIVVALVLVGSRLAFPV